ncbi:hypothetical protein MAR_025794 [Mya arenaria]|uniref:Transposase n=1 Tax=Mya arenaria TaxID=6604 RepID=A0ABY7ET83_MYAAR|nr:hypothetical protein MAR_025794 [Mya arenaria]
MGKIKLMMKINVQKNETKNLKSEVKKVEGQTLSEVVESFELCDLMATCDTKRFKTFWQQWKKSTSKNNGIRWHPMIIRWCLYLQHTSNKSYKALRQSGFIKMPSSHTLFDNSHFTKSTNGITAETVKLLKERNGKKMDHI